MTCMWEPSFLIWLNMWRPAWVPCILLHSVLSYLVWGVFLCDCMCVCVFCHLGWTVHYVDDVQPVNSVFLPFTISCTKTSPIDLYQQVGWLYYYLHSFKYHQLAFILSKHSWWLGIGQTTSCTVADCVTCRLSFFQGDVVHWLSCVSIIQQAIAMLNMQEISWLNLVGYRKIPGVVLQSPLQTEHSI